MVLIFLIRMVRRENSTDRHSEILWVHPTQRGAVLDVWKGLDPQHLKKRTKSVGVRSTHGLFSTTILPWGLKVRILEHNTLGGWSEIFIKSLESFFLNLGKMAKSRSLSKWHAHNSGWTSLFFGRFVSKILKFTWEIFERLASTSTISYTGRVDIFQLFLGIDSVASANLMKKPHRKKGTRKMNDNNKKRTLRRISLN